MRVLGSRSIHQSNLSGVFTKLKGIGSNVLVRRKQQRSPYLAFDFGAESGRALLAELKSGILTTREVYRFRNEPVEDGGSLHWDVEHLWSEIRKALNSLGGVKLAGIGVDAWGVDYALLGERGQLLENPYH
jgi:rhamnulokinase